MFSGNYARRRRPSAGLFLVAVLLAGVVGCGATNPFDMTLVKGKVTYEDGSLIPASRIMIEFTPLGEAVGDRYPRPGRADVDVDNGAFSEASTQKFADGLICGRHKVSVVSYDLNNKMVPLEAVTPEIEITGEEMNLQIKVKKP